MNYMSIIEVDTVNGKGIRTSLFVAGCSFACEGCFNKESWNYKAGKEFDEVAEKRVFDNLSQSWCAGLSILGGDPLAEKNFETVLRLAKKTKDIGKTVWLWTGYTIEEIRNNHASEILDVVDVLIDGRYIKSKHTTSNPWIGSTNQRVLKLDNLASLV